MSWTLQRWWNTQRIFLKYYVPAGNDFLLNCLKLGILPFSEVLLMFTNKAAIYLTKNISFSDFFQQHISNLSFFATDDFCLFNLLAIVYLVFVYSISSLYSLKTRRWKWLKELQKDCNFFVLSEIFWLMT